LDDVTTICKIEDNVSDQVVKMNIDLKGKKNERGKDLIEKRPN